MTNDRKSHAMSSEKYTFTNQTVTEKTQSALADLAGKKLRERRVPSEHSGFAKMRGSGPARIRLLTGAV